MFGMSSVGNAAAFKVLYTFGTSGSSDAALPEGPMIMDAAGNLYGTTVGGGLYGGGTVFELVKNSTGSWTEKILYNFKDGADGGLPLGTIVFDAEGNLYGAASQGGLVDQNCTIGCGVVFELTPSSGEWTETVLYTFTGIPDGGMPSGVVMDAAGNLYGTTTIGGVANACSLGCGTVFKLIKADAWKKEILHTFFNYPVDGAYPIGGVVFDAKGNLYGTTDVGGLSGGFEADGTVFELSPGAYGTWTESILHTFCYRSVFCGDGNGPEAGVTLANGKIFGTTNNGGPSAEGTVFQLIPENKGWSVSYFDFDDLDGLGPMAPLLFLNQKFYGVTSQGGISNGACALINGNGVIFEVAQRAQRMKENVIYEFTGGNDGCGPSAGLVADAAGNLYGTSFQGGPANGGAVFEVTP
ncbi:MAG TPA: choice-of-anchor tandem repeat GloVer-containing protein [Candidatus Sulfotelmatobacter sp.]|jgi:uncharacterized repeat protein (TIGR03803 family)